MVRPTKIATFWPTKGNHFCVTPNDCRRCFLSKRRSFWRASPIWLPPPPRTPGLNPPMFENTRVDKNHDFFQKNHFFFNDFFDVMCRRYPPNTVVPNLFWCIPPFDPFGTFHSSLIIQSVIHSSPITRACRNIWSNNIFFLTCLLSVTV